jgi:hypothetical protein
MTEMNVTRTEDQLYVSTRHESNGGVTEAFRGTVVKRDRSKRGKRVEYALIEADVPQNGQRPFRVYDGRFCTVSATPNYPALNMFGRKLPSIGERVVFTTMPDKYRSDGKLASFACREEEYEAAQKHYRQFGNWDKPYRLAQDTDLTPGAELLMVRYNTGDDGMTIVLADKPLGSVGPGGPLHLHYSFKGDEGHTVHAPVKNLLAQESYPYDDKWERVVLVVPLEEDEIAIEGCVCAHCGVWVQESMFHVCPILF